VTEKLKNTQYIHILLPCLFHISMSNMFCQFLSGLVIFCNLHIFGCILVDMVKFFSVGDYGNFICLPMLTFPFIVSSLYDLSFCGYLSDTSTYIIMFLSLMTGIIHGLINNSYVVKINITLENKNNINSKKMIIQKETIPFELKERMLYHENTSKKISVIPQTQPFIVKITGRAFKNLISDIKKDSVYSIEFKKSMILTATDLLKEFGPSTAYTQTNEIVLIFNRKIEGDHIFNGCVNKILSNISGYASASFDRHLTDLCGRQKRIPSFNSRLVVFPLGKDYEIFNYMYWRSSCDSVRNFIAMYAEKYIGKHEIHNMSQIERIKNLKELGHDLDDHSKIDVIMKFGVFISAPFEEHNDCEIITLKDIYGYKYSESNLKRKITYYIFNTLEYTSEMVFFLLGDDIDDDIINESYTGNNLSDLFNIS
jgi:tRNA(His) 5'-end guanylyltransferase